MPDEAECIFCGLEPGSHEHIWPNWVGRYLRSLHGPGLTADPSVEALLDLQVECVCDTCNRKWMARLETHVAPIMKQMMVGESVVLDRRDVERLRRWAIKTAIAFECYYQPVAASRAARDAVKNSREGRHSLVLLGRYGGIKRVLDHHRILYTDSLNDDAYMSWTTIVVQQIVFYVLTDANVRNPDVSLGPDPLGRFINLVPGEIGKIEWPPHDLNPLDDATIDLLSSGPNDQLRGAPYRPL